MRMGRRLLAPSRSETPDKIEPQTQRPEHTVDFVKPEDVLEVEDVRIHEMVDL